MRVTNQMLSANLMRNLHANYRRSDKLQNMMSTGRKFANISDNPTALIYSQAARNKMARLSHYQTTIGTANSWLAQAENSTRELNDVIVSAYELLVDAATDAKTDKDKRNISEVFGQLTQHYVDTLNTTFGNNFVFGGYNTTGDNPEIGPINLLAKGIRPFMLDDNEPPNLYFNGLNLSQFDGMPAEWLFTDDPASIPPGDLIAQNIDPDDFLMMHELRNHVLTFDVGPGIEMKVTMNGIDIVLFPTHDPQTGQSIIRNTHTVLNDLYDRTREESPNDADASELTLKIKQVQDAQNHTLTKIAEIGGRVRRLELLGARYEQDQVNNRQMLSDAEDVDMAEVIMELRMAEAVMQASMAAGARIIQPTLMDFLR